MLIPELGVGGASAVVENLSKGLSKKYTVLQCTFCELEDGLKFSYRKRLSLNVSAGKTAFGKLIRFMQRCARLSRVIKSYDIQYSISHMEGANYVNVLSAGKAKTICCVHSTNYLTKVTRFPSRDFVRARILMPLILNRSHMIIAVSYGIKKILIEQFRIRPDKVKVIYNPFDIQLITAKSEEKLDSKYTPIFRHPVIITAGRLVKEKNHEALLDIASKVLKKHTFKLVILGDGYLKEGLHRKSTDMGLRTYDENNSENISDEYDIYFLGHKPNPYSFLKQSLLFILTSRNEGFPLSLCEAMACGVPVIAADCPTGPREILSAGYYPNGASEKSSTAICGILLPVPMIDNQNSNTDMWDKSVSELFQNSQLRKNLITNARNRVNDFSVDKIRDKWSSLII